MLFRSHQKAMKSGEVSEILYDVGPFTLVKMPLPEKLHHTYHNLNAFPSYYGLPLVCEAHTHHDLVAFDPLFWKSSSPRSSSFTSTRWFFFFFFLSVYSKIKFIFSYHLLTERSYVLQLHKLVFGWARRHFRTNHIT